MSFATNLKKIMTEKNMSQVDLSNATGISRSGISQYLSGKYEPKQKAITKIADVLGCTADDLTSKQISIPKTDGLKNLPVDVAAQLLGTSKQFIRVGLQNGTLPFGYAVKISDRFTYYISPIRFTECTGIKI